MANSDVDDKSDEEVNLACRDEDVPQCSHTLKTFEEIVDDATFIDGDQCISANGVVHDVGGGPVEDPNAASSDNYNNELTLSATVEHIHESIHSSGCSPLSVPVVDQVKGTTLDHSESDCMDSEQSSCLASPGYSSDTDTNTNSTDSNNSHMTDSSEENCYNSQSPDHKMIILSCFMKHKFSKEASKDVLSLMKKLSPDSTVLKEIKFQDLWDIAGKSNVKEVHYCEICNTIFPDDPQEVHCGKQACFGLRYVGGVDKQSQKGRRPRKMFLLGDVSKQLSNILQTESMCIIHVITKSRPNFVF